jgi:hypothetical protein
MALLYWSSRHYLILCDPLCLSAAGSPLDISLFNYRSVERVEFLYSKLTKNSFSLTRLDDGVSASGLVPL